MYKKYWRENDMKIGKSFGEREICIGDLYQFDFKELEGTPFINSNLYEAIKKYEADDLYIYFSLNPYYNIVEYDMQFLKENKLVYSEKANDSMFLTYLASKGDYIHYLLNNSLAKNNKAETLRQLSISKEDARLNYGDLFLVSLDDVKKTGYIKSNFMEKFENEGVLNFLFHFYDMRNEIKHSHNNVGMCCYAVSEKGFVNTFPEKEREFLEERYKKSKNEFDKVPEFIIQYSNNLNINTIKKLDHEYRFFDNKIGNIQNAYKLDYGQVKDIIEKKYIRIEIKKNPSSLMIKKKLPR